jgi:hypothetical protein
MVEMELLTPREKDALTHIARAAKELRVICGGADTADWVEAAADIHRLQQRVMSNAAARAYPDEFRLLGSD